MLDDVVFVSGWVAFGKDLVEQGDVILDMIGENIEGEFDVGDLELTNVDRDLKVGGEVSIDLEDKRLKILHDWPEFIANLAFAIHNRVYLDDFDIGNPAPGCVQVGDTVALGTEQDQAAFDNETLGGRGVEETETVIVMVIKLLEAPPSCLVDGGGKWNDAVHVDAVDHWEGLLDGGMIGGRWLETPGRVG